MNDVELTDKEIGSGAINFRLKAYTNDCETSPFVIEKA